MNTCSDIPQTLSQKCKDIPNPIQELFGNVCNEASVRLAHMGIFPIDAKSPELGNCRIYFKDVNGFIIGTSNKDEALLSQSPKPNKNLTRIERNQLTKMGLLKKP